MNMSKNEHVGRPLGTELGDGAGELTLAVVEGVRARVRSVEYEIALASGTSKIRKGTCWVLGKKKTGQLAIRYP